MDEVFVEQIVKRQTNISGVLLRIFSVFVVLIGVMSILWLGILGFTLTVLLGYASYMVWLYTNVEYEYSLLNGDFTVDKIMGQSRRKNIANYNIREAEIIAPVMSEQVVRASMNAVLKDYSSGNKKRTVYAMIINNANGKVKVLFEPNEKVIEAMHHVRPNIVIKAE